MKTNNLFLTTITCIGGFLFLIICTYLYRSKLSEIEQQAKMAFIEAVNQEMKNRNIEGAIISSIDASESVDNAELPDSVFIVTDSGKIWYRADSKKDRMNITNITKIRLLHSCVFQKHPLFPDSLNTIWRDYLLKSHLSTKSALCLSLTDKEGNSSSKYTSQSEYCTPSNFIFTTYLGYASEIEIMAYLKYSIWNEIYIEIVFLLLLHIGGVYGIYRMFLVIQQKVIEKQESRIPEKAVEIVMEEVSNTTIHTYVLHENIYFNAEQNKMEKEGMTKKLPAQSNRLLELFLQNKDNNYILSDNVIIENLWPDGSGDIYKMHKAITRLRSIINKFDNSIRIVRGTEMYRLHLD